MTEIKNMKVYATYEGKTEYNNINDNKYYFHQFVSVNKTNDLKWIKIIESNPIISSLNLKEGKRYELNWIEKNNKTKRVFQKNDNIVIIDYNEEPNLPTPENSPIENNTCDNCQKSICKDDGKFTYQYFISVNGKEIYKNKRWCSKCLPVVQGLCNAKIWGVNEDEVFGSNAERLHKSKCKIKTVNGHKTLSVDLNYGNGGSPWTCPWCDQWWNDNESKTIALNHYSSCHNITKNKEDEPSREENQEPDDDHNSDDNSNELSNLDALKKYCQKQGINGLEYEDGKLIIHYNTGKPDKEVSIFDKELKKIKNYLKKKGKSRGRRKYLESSDWEEDNSHERHERGQEKKPTDYTPWIVGAVALFTIVVLAIVAMSKNNRSERG